MSIAMDDDMNFFDDRDTFIYLLNDAMDDRAYHDNFSVLHEPPEYRLPEWERNDEIPPWETHDWTNDYDYADVYTSYEDGE